MEDRPHVVFSGSIEPGYTWWDEAVWRPVRGDWPDPVAAGPGLVIGGVHRSAVVDDRAVLMVQAPGSWTHVMVKGGMAFAVRRSGEKREVVLLALLHLLVGLDDDAAPLGRDHVDTVLESAVIPVSPQLDSDYALERRASMFASGVGQDQMRFPPYS
jgi:hypothetical protein